LKNKKASKSSSSDSKSDHEEELQEKINELQNLLQQEKERVQQLVKYSTQLGELKEVIEEHEEKISSSDKKIFSLERSLQEKDSEINGLQSEVSNLQAELTEYRKPKGKEPNGVLNLQPKTTKPQIKNIGSSKVESIQPKTPTDLNSPFKSEVGNLPSWRLREIERKKEEEAKRLEEQAKRQELARSISSKTDIVVETHSPGFVDPLTRKVPEAQSADTEIAYVKEIDEQAILEAEMARMNRAIKKGGTTTLL